jgi:hypothetical protein
VLFQYKLVKNKAGTTKEKLGKASPQLSRGLGEGPYGFAFRFC